MKNQKGTTLVELMLTLSLMGIIAVSSFSGRSNEMDVVMAKGFGSKLLEYNTAVQSYISTNPNLSYPVTRTGSAWLKHTSCTGGLSSHPYLPCEFPDFISHSESSFGDVIFTTALTRTTVSGQHFISASTETTPLHHNYVQRADLAGVSAIIAASGRAITDSPALMTTNASYGSDPFTAKVTMTASNTPSSDTWLRTDGANTMKANLIFDTGIPADQREIHHVSTIQSHGTEKLSIQSESSNSEFTVEPNKVSSKSGSSLFEVNPTRAITTVGTAALEVGSGKVVNRVGTSSSEVNSTRVISKVGSNSSIDISSSSISNRVGSTAIEINSSKVSTMGDHQIRGIASVNRNGSTAISEIRDDPNPAISDIRLAANGNMTISAGSLLGSSIITEGTVHTNGDVHVDGFFSHDVHPNVHELSFWRVMPGDHTQLNNVNIRGNFILERRDSPNGFCSRAGALGTDSAGALMSCHNNSWRKIKIHAD